jgi:quercetin dioxygenase-like cupin family protein
MRIFFLRISFLIGFLCFFSAIRAQDADKMGPHVYKVLADSLGIKIYKVTFKPGDEVKMHAHPDHAVYALEGGTLEITMKDGKKENFSITPGMAAVFAEESHSAKNIGTTSVVAIVVEVRRKRE